MKSHTIQVKHAPEDIKRLLISAGLKLKECANIFGIILRGWQKKEESNTVSSRCITKGEYLYLLLLTEEHPGFTLKKRNDTEK